MTVRATEQWIGTDAASWSSQWTTGVGSTSTVTIVSNAGRMVAQGAAYAYGRALLSGMTAQTDTDVLVKHTYSDAGEQYALIILRHSGSWDAGTPQEPNDGYWVATDPNSGNVLIEKNVAGTKSTLDTTAQALVAGTAYWFRVQATGTTIRWRAWADGSTEPSTWTASITDASHTSGKVALAYVNGAGGTAETGTWDDLQVTDMVAAPYAVAQFDGNYIGDGTDYAGGLQGASTLPPVTGTVEMQSRRSIEPQVMSVSRDGRTLALTLYPAQGTSLSLATFRSRVKQWFTPGKNTAARYLVLYADDGSTFVRIATYVQSVTMSRKQIDIVLTMAQPWFEAYIPTVSSANPATVTNSGNVAARPSIALTQTTHKTLRACTVAAAAGTSLVAYPIRFTLDDAVATSTNVFVFVNGVSVPCNVQGGGGASSVVWALVDCAPDASSTSVDIIYGSGITNSLCGTLNDPDLFDSASTSNTSWRYDDWSITTHASHPGSWVPATTGYHAAGAYQLTSDGTTSVVFDLVASGTSDYDSMVVLTPTVASSLGTSAGTGLDRTTANLGGTNAQAYVRFRTANNDRWSTAWSTRANATVTGSVGTITGCLALAVGIENDGTTADPATFTVDEGSGGTAVLAVTSPTVNVAAAANIDYYDGTLVVGSYTLTFNDCFAPDGTLTIDCGTKSISSSAAGAVYNAPTFSDPSVWAALEPGSNTITDGLTTAADTITHRNSFE